MRACLAIFGLVAVVLGTPGDRSGLAVAAPSNQPATDWAETLALARNGDARAQFLVGSAFARDEGVKFDPVEASEWYRRAAAQGLPEAQYALGLVYSEGRGVYRNSAEAYFWCHLAASQGHPGAAACRDGIAQGLSPLRLSAAKERLGNWQPRPDAAPPEDFGAETQPPNDLSASELGQANTETQDAPVAHGTASKAEGAGTARAHLADTETAPGDGTAQGEPIQEAATPEPSSGSQAEEAPADAPGTGMTASPLPVETLAAPDVDLRIEAITAIHLASVRTRDASGQAWAELQQRFPKLLAGRTPIVRPVELEGQGTYYRVMTGPYEDHAVARGVCDDLMQQDQYCSLVPLNEENDKEVAVSNADSSDAGRAAFAVHLLSAKTESRASKSWAVLQQQFPGLLGDKNLAIRTIDVAGESRFYRVMAGPIASRAEALALCSEFEADEQYCSVVDLVGDLPSDLATWHRANVRLQSHAAHMT